MTELEPWQGVTGENRRFEVAIVADDLTRIDPQDLYSQAERLARGIHRGATLRCPFPIRSHGDLTGGRTDLTTKDSWITYDFAADEVDPTKPPGKDHVRRDIDVKAKLGKLRADVRTEQSVRTGGCPPVPAPSCSVVRAWDVAVQTGVPTNAVAWVVYYDDGGARGGGPYVWSFRVEGYDEHRREIDGMTCRLVRSWAKRR